MTAIELLRAVADAHPDDFAERLRLADWYATAGDPDRAEFVRLQVEELRFGGRTPEPLRVRAAALLKAHEGVWRMAGCSECGGTRRSARNGTCLTCNGNGDVGGLVTVTNGKPFFTLPVVWRGGTPHAVVCLLSEAFAGDGTPSRWAFQVAAHNPTVREFRLPDRDPERGDDYQWSLRAGDRAACETDTRRLPRPLIDAALRVGTHTRVKYRRDDPALVAALYYPTAATAHDAVAVAAGTIVRAAVDAARA